MDFNAVLMLAICIALPFAYGSTTGMQQLNILYALPDCGLSVLQLSSTECAMVFQDHNTDINSNI